MKYIMGIDIGTSGTKAVAFSHQGEVLGSAYRSYEPVDTIASHHELDPSVLYDAFIAVVSELLSSLEGKASMTALAFSSAMHSLLLVDQQHRPLTNLITWADIRATEEAQSLKSSLDGAEIYRVSGTPIHPMSPLCKLMWFHKNEPALFQKAAKFISIKEYILYRVTGKYLVDHSLASGTGLFDIYQLKWNDSALTLCGIRADQLSEPVVTTHIENIDFRLGDKLVLKTQLVIGATDGCLANLGSNAVKPGDVSLTIGTSGAVRMVSTAPKHDRKGRIFNYILSPELFVSGGPINNGGILLKWYSENFLHYEDEIREITSGELKQDTAVSVKDGEAGKADQKADAPVDFESFVNTAMTVPPGSEGLIFLPYIQGERAPVWDAQAKGVFFGVTAVHTQAHFMRAIIEGICFSLLDVSQSLEETLGPISNVYASGGFVKSPAWVQTLCDILGKKILITDTADASSIGAAMLGLYATKVIDRVEDAARFLSIQTTYSPAASASSSYTRNFRIYQNLYHKLKDEFTM